MHRFRGIPIFIVALIIGLGRQQPVLAQTRQAWEISHPIKNHEIEGYASSTSVSAGDIINFHVSSATPTFDAYLYRLGWYDGRGAELMAEFRELHARQEPIPEPDQATGLIDLNWPTTLSTNIPYSWPSGVYLLKLVGASGFESYIPFVVRDLDPRPFAFIHSVNTDEAYNYWGGESLYNGRTPALNLPRAVKVSFDRPFQDSGAGWFLNWEYPLIRFLERQGYAVGYLTDVDVHEHPEWLKSFRAILIVGHNEYWSKSMRDGYTAAVAAGANLAVFGGNTGYRQIRYEPSPTTGAPDRVIVAYKNAQLDPELAIHPELVTVNWRDNIIGRPESRLLGAMYGSTVKESYPLVIRRAGHWVFHGTNLRRGDGLPGLVGYERDKVYQKFPRPAHLAILTSSPIEDPAGIPDKSNSTIYTTSQGASVFNAGTIQWSWGVDDFFHPGIVDWRIQRITVNILRRFSGLPDLP